MFESLSKLLKEETPFALVTVIEGTNKGAKLLVQPLEKSLEGTLGNESLDRVCLLYTSPSPRDVEESRMPSSA